MGFRNKDRPIGFAIAILLFGLVLRALALFAGRRPVDDAYITLRYAFNIAHSGAWFFNAPGEEAQGASSLLWTLVLAPFSRALSPGDPNAITLLAGLGIALQLSAIAYLLIRGARETGALRWQALGLALLVAISPTALDQAASGMESSLVLLLLSVVAMSRPLSTTWSLALGLLPLARPEAAVTLVLPIAGIVLFAAYRERRIREALVSIGFMALSASVVLATAAWLRGGSPIPTTLHAKNATYDLLCGAPDRLTSFIAELSALSGIAMAGDGSLLRQGLGLLLAIGVAVAGIDLVRRSRRADDAAWLFAWLACVAFQAFAVKWTFPWYPATGGFVALVLLSRWLERYRQWPIGIVMVMAFLGVSLFKLRHLDKANVDRLATGAFDAMDYERTGLLLRESGIRGPVLVEAAGAVGFYSGAVIADSIGLVSSDVPKARASGDCWYEEVVRRLRPEAIVLRERELVDNRDFVCGYRERLACQGSPIPPGYARLGSAPSRVESVGPLTILRRKRTD